MGYSPKKAPCFHRISRSLGDFADAVSFGATISACEKCGMWESALDLMQEMVVASLAEEDDTANSVDLGLQQFDRNLCHSLTYIYIFMDPTVMGPLAVASIYIYISGFILSDKLVTQKWEVI